MGGPVRQVIRTDIAPRRAEVKAQEDEEDAEFAKLREMLLSTQNDIDRII